MKNNWAAGMQCVNVLHARITGKVRITQKRINSPRPLTGIAHQANDATDNVDSIRRHGQFLIYCYDEHGRYGLPVGYDEVKDIFEFCELNRYSHREIKVISNDEINVLVQNGSYVSPKEWDRFNKN
ncbi:hypothetical protein AB4Z50_14565 [Paenibacillus sp. 2TAB26]|uniref:hypothetical protein n=1 Tax=Paenibacillus sp. 2TAB26 TaxID=3233005 RepID=UPI003F9C661E